MDNVHSDLERSRAAAAQRIRRKTVNDSFFGNPYHDVDEWREDPVRHRYVHGGFEGTNARFSFYFPPEEKWGGRFIQPDVGGMGGNEKIAQTPMAELLGSIPFAVSIGAYLVESNQGHRGMDMDTGSDDPSIAQYRADAQAARHSKAVAAEIYGSPPTYGYRVGGSGGSVRTINAMENVTDVWDGSVPHIMPNITTGGFCFSLSALATRVLGPKLTEIADAVDVGGTGDPFESLNTEQREVLASLYRAGFPRGAEFALNDPFSQLLVWTWHGPGMIAADPDYFESDFWSKPGYAGFDQRDRLEPYLFTVQGTVERVVRASQLIDPDADSGTTGDVQASAGTRAVARGIAVHDLDDVSKAPGSRIEIRSGKARGRVLYCLSASRGVLYGMALGESGNLLFEGVEPGDEVSISNRDFLAFNYLHRHSATTSLAEVEQFKIDGQAIYPQRGTSLLAGSQMPGDERAANGPRMFGGNFHGKMIIVQNLLDTGTWPMGPVHYEQAAREHFGDDTPNRLRVYYNESAAHLPGSAQPTGERPVITTRLIDFPGSVEQAVRDLIDWVEFGKEPPASSRYEVSPDLAVTVPLSATDRGGIQPVVHASANGAVSAEVAVGEDVVFVIDAEVPPGTGTLISATWDWDGSGAFPFRHDVDGSQTKVTLESRHSYVEPGTYFATARVASHRDGAVDALHRRCHNLARVRINVRA
jgi:hypothetical protein